MRSPVLVAGDCVHTRLPHSFKENAGRAKRGTRGGKRGRKESIARVRVSLFFPGHRQNKYPAIFAMHLLLLPSLSLALFLLSPLSLPPTRSRSLPLLGTVSRYLFTLSFVPHRHRDQPRQRIPTTQYILMYILLGLSRYLNAHRVFENYLIYRRTFHLQIFSIDLRLIVL